MWSRGNALTILPLFVRRDVRLLMDPWGQKRGRRIRVSRYCSVRSPSLNLNLLDAQPLSGVSPDHQEVRGHSPACPPPLVLLCVLCENLHHSDILAQCDFYAQMLLLLSKGPFMRQFN